jgi:hypothetical protein
MSRFEMTISGGERIIVDHPAQGMQELLSEMMANDFLLLTEIRGSATVAPQGVIVASGQVTLVRAIDGDSRQGSTFRPKR